MTDKPANIEFAEEDKEAEDIANLALSLQEIGKYVADLKPETLQRFLADVKSVDEVEDALLEPFGAEARKKLREYTVKQVEALLDLKRIIDNIRTTKAEHLKALAVREDFQNKVKKGLI